MSQVSIEDSGTHAIHHAQTANMYHNPSYPIPSVPIYYNQTLQHPIQQPIPNGAQPSVLPTLLPPFTPPFSHSASNVSSNSVGSNSAVDMSPLPPGMFPMNPAMSPLLHHLNSALNPGLQQMYPMAPLPPTGQFIPMMQYQTPGGQTKVQKKEDEEKSLEDSSRASYPPSNRTNNAANFPMVFPNTLLESSQYIPMISVETPDGPKLQPLVYYSSSPGLPATSPYFAMPRSSSYSESEANANKNLKARARTSSSRSFDGSECSDDGKVLCLPSTSFQRNSSSISRDGYATARKGCHRRSRSRPMTNFNLALIRPARSRTQSSASQSSKSSDFADNYSRHGSLVGDYFPDTDHSDIDENGEVESPANKNIITGSPETFLNAFDSLIESNKIGQASSDDASDCNKSELRKPATKQAEKNFLAAFQTKPRHHPRRESEEFSRSGSRSSSKGYMREKKHSGSRYSSKSSERSDSYSGKYGSYRGDKKRPTSKERQEELFKTELCNAWVNGQRCRFGKRCMFAHGQHELKSSQRKMDRNRQKPMFRKQLSNLLDKISEGSSSSSVTDLLCLTVEEIQGDEKESMFAVKCIFTKACNEQKLMRVYSTIWQKLLNVHPMKKRMQRQMFELCLCEYKAPRLNHTGLGCMMWIAELCRRNSFQGDIVYKILDDMFANGDKKEAKVEMWCSLIQSLEGCVNTNKYFDRLSSFKSKFGQRIRFLIKDLEEKSSRNWVPITA